MPCPRRLELGHGDGYCLAHVGKEDKSSSGKTRDGGTAAWEEMAVSELTLEIMCSQGNDGGAHTFVPAQHSGLELSHLEWSSTQCIPPAGQLMAAQNRLALSP